MSSAPSRQSVLRDALARQRAAAAMAKIPAGGCLVITQVKDEALDILEWLAWHRLIGADGFLIFDNDSADGTDALLSAVADRADVTTVAWPRLDDAEKPQFSAFDAVIAAAQRLPRDIWIAFLDVDEFLVLKKHGNLGAFLANFADADAIAVNWVLFGSSKHVARPPGLVVENYLKRSAYWFEANRHVKTIVRSSALRGHLENGHYFDIRDPERYVFADKSRFPMKICFEKDSPTPSGNHRGILECAQIHHYAVKSKEDWERKMRRGRVSRAAADAALTDSENRFRVHDRNGMDDDYMLRHVTAIRAEIARLRGEDMTPAAQPTPALIKPPAGPTLIEARIDEVDLIWRDNGVDDKVVNATLRHGEFSPLADVVAQDRIGFIIDAGGFIGTAAIAFARLFPDAVIVSIEPDEENFQLLVRNTRRFPNIIPIQAALATEVGMAQLFDRDTGPWGFTLVEAPRDRGAPDGRGVTQTISIDRLLRIFAREGVDILKIDIEGGEHALFADPAAWIERVGVISVELHDRIVAGCRQRFEAATAHMRPLATFSEKAVRISDAYFGNQLEATI